MVGPAGKASPPEGSKRATPRRDAKASSGRGFTPAAILGALGLVLAAGAVALVRPHGPHPVTSAGEAAIGGPFQLQDTSGHTVDQRLLLGKWSAVFFGYTNCPDTCPATLQALNAAAGQLGAGRSRFQVVFISVDPARDTPARMKLYADSQGYPPGALVGLTGTPAEVKTVADAYHAFYAKSGDGPDYAMEHSAAVYLMDPRGHFVRPLNETDPPAALAGQIRAAQTGSGMAS